MSITFPSRGVFGDRTLSDFCHQHRPPFDLRCLGSQRGCYRRQLLSLPLHLNLFLSHDDVNQRVLSMTSVSLLFLFISTVPTDRWWVFNRL